MDKRSRPAGDAAVPAPKRPSERRRGRLGRHSTKTPTWTRTGIDDDAAGSSAPSGRVLGPSKIVLSGPMGRGMTALQHQARVGLLSEVPIIPQSMTTEEAEGRPTSHSRGPACGLPNTRPDSSSRGPTKTRLSWTTYRHVQDRAHALGDETPSLRPAPHQLFRHGLKIDTTQAALGVEDVHLYCPYIPDNLGGSGVQHRL